jgi:drug/metabolite transporter (DMT)-like permease
VRELFVDHGLRWTLLAAVLYAPAVVLIKQVIVRSDAYFANLMAYLAASLVILPLALWRSPRHFTQIPHHWPSFVGMGLFASLGSICHSLAYQLTLTSYVEAVKQAEILFALGLGYVVFQERTRVRAILPGSLIILLGVVLLHLSG